MTDISIKASLSREGVSEYNSTKGHYVTDSTRKQVSIHNRNSHFIMGKHSTIHYSTTALSTAHRQGLIDVRCKTGLTINKTGSNFKIGAVKLADN